jgi:hypothetical protein
LLFKLSNARCFKRILVQHQFATFDKLGEASWAVIGERVKELLTSFDWKLNSSVLLGVFIAIASLVVG